MVCQLIVSMVEYDQEVKLPGDQLFNGNLTGLDKTTSFFFQVK